MSTLTTKVQSQVAAAPQAVQEALKAFLAYAERRGAASDILELCKLRVYGVESCRLIAVVLLSERQYAYELWVVSADGTSGEVMRDGARYYGGACFSGQSGQAYGQLDRLTGAPCRTYIDHYFGK